MNEPVQNSETLPPLSDSHAWMTPQAVSADIGRAASTLAAWRKQNLYLDFYKFGRRVLYLRRDVERFNSSCLVRCKSAEVVRHAHQS
jgi:hypothetical protein